MSDSINLSSMPGTSEQPPETSPVPAMLLGMTMPDAGEIPTLTAPPPSDDQRAHDGPGALGLSVLQHGWQFKGTARIAGACSIAGTFEGQLYPLPEQSATIVITETGVVQADLHVSYASVMGLYAGTLHAPGGRVELHPGATVSGHIRYGRLQVNDADLNATLERINATQKTA